VQPDILCTVCVGNHRKSAICAAEQAAASQASDSLPDRHPESVDTQSRGTLLSRSCGSQATFLVYLRMFCCLTSADADIVRPVSTFRISEAATLLGVSDDTVRRWVDAGRLPTSGDAGRRRTIDGAALAHFAEELASSVEPARAAPVVSESARNRFTGLVTRVVRDTVMAQVEIQAGPHRVVSLMSREAADELRLEPGSLAVASVKATNVVVEIPGAS